MKIECDQSSAEEHLLFVVQEAFTIGDLGTILTPGFVREGAPVSTLAGARLRLHRPDASDVIADSCDEAVGLNLRSPYLPVLVRGIHKRDVPPGTEVWYISNASSGPDR
jgi:hypothetical protein